MSWLKARLPDLSNSTTTNPTQKLHIDSKQSSRLTRTTGRHARLLCRLILHMHFSILSHRCGSSHHSSHMHNTQAMEWLLPLLLKRDALDRRFTLNTTLPLSGNWKPTSLLRVVLLLLHRHHPCRLVPARSAALRPVLPSKLQSMEAS
jgi:hypothetical protein